MYPEKNPSSAAIGKRGGDGGEVAEFPVVFPSKPCWGSLGFFGSGRILISWAADCVDNPCF